MNRRFARITQHRARAACVLSAALMALTCSAPAWAEETGLPATEVSSGYTWVLALLGVAAILVASYAAATIGRREPRRNAPK